MGPLGDYKPLKIDRVANPTPGKMNLIVKCQTSRESAFARTLTVHHPARRSGSLDLSLQGIRSKSVYRKQKTFLITPTILGDQNQLDE